MVHQLLHGYDSGHTLLASSRQLDEMSSALVGLLSDLAPATPEAPEEGWLTIYPVAEAELFAIARTWPAPEMARPGCVWTHTILLDYGQVANLASLRQVLALHRKPVDGIFEGYGDKIALTKECSAARIVPPEYQAGRQLLHALYDGNQSIVGLTEQDVGERLMMAIWDQQWPRLRRRFRACSICVREAGMGNWRFDMMFARDRAELRELASKPRIVDLRGRGAKERAPGWVTAALADLRSGGSPFRSKLRSLAADISSGRRAFPVLSSIIALGERPHPADLGNLVSGFRQRVADGEGREAQLALASAVVRQPRGLKKEVLDFCIPRLGELAKEQSLDAFARELWRISRKNFWTALPLIPNGRTAFEAFLATVRLDELVEALGRPQARVDDAILLRPEIGAMPGIWTDADPIAAHVLNLAPTHAIVRKHALSGAFTTRADGAAEALASHTSAVELYDTLLGAPSDREWSPFDARWLLRAVRDAGATEAYLRSTKGLRREALLIVARRTGFHAYAPASGQPDVWYSAFRHAQGKISAADEQYLQAFLMVRALHYRSSDRAQILASVYEPIARALSSGSAREDVVDMLDKQLPGDFSWFWLETRTTRIRRSVAKALVTSGIPLAPTIASISIEAAKYLVKSLSDVNGGSAQLRSARQALASAKAPQERLLIIDNQLKPKRK